MSSRQLFVPCLALVVSARLAAQSLPPPPSGGVVDIEAAVGAETRTVQHDYAPPRRAVILAETLRHERHAVPAVSIAQTETVPAQAGSTTATFVFDPGYAASHPAVVRPVRGASDGIFFGTNRYSRLVLTTTWDGQGVPTFALQATAASGGGVSIIEGRGSGRFMGTGPSNVPSPRFFAPEVTRAEGQVGRFRFGPEQDYRFLLGTSQYWTERQADGADVVFHTSYFTESVPGLREYQPIGEVVVAGTPGRAAGVRVTYQTTEAGQPLEASAAYAALRDESWTFTGNDQPDAGTTAGYSFSSTVASASKLRYKVQLQPGLARTVSWTETFTPEGAGEPSEHRFHSESVGAGATETTARVLDPFAWLGDQPGTYEVVAYDGESLAAALTTDVNGDGQIVSPANPITPYIIAHADQLADGASLALAANHADADGDGVIDGTDGVVNGAADLANFIPVYLDLSGLVGTLPPTSGFIYKLKHADGALNLVYTNLTPTTAFAYRAAPESGFGPGLDEPAATALVIPITAEGVDLFGGEKGSGAFLEAIRTQGGGIILVEARRATAQPLILTVAKPDGTVLLALPLPLMVSAPPSLAVDANRDGEIKLPGEEDADVTSAVKPYRFWLNDDDDVDDDDPDDSEVAPVVSADWLDDKIDGVRDLEDFARLKIYLGGLQDAVRQGQMRIGLKWKDTTGGPGIKLWRNLSPNGGTEYLTDTTVAQQHLALRQPGTIQGALSYMIPTQYWVDAGLSTSQPYGHLLFEGISAGKGQLVVTLHNADGSEIAEGAGAWLDLKNVKSMYERVKATADGAENFPFPYNHVGADPVPVPAMGWTADPVGYPFEPAQGETQTYIVFVHGWNQTYERSTMYAETVFKRMWHRSYKGRFVRFRWPTFTGLTTYNDSEYRAWKCGESLKQYLGTLPSGYTVNLVAHSMGNIVAGSALEKGASVANYALLNAAVPAICYDTSGTVVQTSWGYVTPNDDPDSTTRSLSYQGRLANVSGNLVNFFLATDSALAAWEINNDSPSGGRYPIAGAKPHQWPEASINAGYRYQPTAAAGQKLRVVRVAGERLLNSADEAMGFAVQAPSLTAGADGRTRGSIDDWVDMATYGFDSVHSAEFLFTIHQTRDFYGALLLKLGVAVQP